MGRDLLATDSRVSLNAFQLGVVWPGLSRKLDFGDLETLWAAGLNGHQAVTQWGLKLLTMLWK